MKESEILTQDKAIVLTDKNARLICARKKKEIITDSLSGKHVNQPIFLCGDKVYGILVLNEPTNLDEGLFKNHYKRHLIDEKTKDELWPDATKYYSYSFRIKRIFKEPVDLNREFNGVEFLDNLEIPMEKRKKFIKGVIGFKDLGKAPIETPWDGSAERAKATVEVLKIISAWFDSAKPDVKSSYKLPHHKAEGKYVAVWNGVRAAMAALLGARGGADIPTKDRMGVYNHLVRHYKQFDKEPPVFKNYTDRELEKMFPEFYEKSTIEEIDFQKYYDMLEKLEKNTISKKGYTDIRILLLKLYKLLLNKMELKKSEHGRRCTAADRRAGRCSVGQIYRNPKYDNYDETGFVKAPKIDITDKYIRIRLREPSTIVDNSFRTITLSESRGIKAVIGRLKTDPSGPTHVQSVLFDRDRWNSKDALAWVHEHSDSLKSAIQEGKKTDKTTKALLEYKTIICHFCDRDFKYKDNGHSGVYAKCPYCEKVDYYS